MEQWYGLQQGRVSTGMTVTAWPGYVTDDRDRYRDRQSAWPWSDLTEGVGYPP
jgi:hypothetical protein